MLYDEKECSRMKSRRDLFTNVFVNSKYDIDEKASKYFLDIVDDISLAKDFAKSEVSVESINRENTNILKRMYIVGTILNSGNPTKEQKEYVNSYIDSCCVDYAKVFYEVGLIKFKDDITKVINTIYGDVDFYEALIATSTTLDDLINMGNKKTKKKAIH